MTTLPATGDSITFRKTMTVAEQGFFTGITGNMTKSHVDRAYAKSVDLPDMSVFELAAAGLLTTALGRLCGADWRIGNFTVAFGASFPVGSSLAATATVTEATYQAIDCTLTIAVEGTETITGAARMVPLKG
ncbi:acyl dehydratase [Donghicola mangrovi]|uniref:Acyl dehydratase n=1 Tax=Donghicola mangrovi TaxID=2729614 RepID=A0A850QF05_9RHOB|nr:acyl dehydratase [Donghicola mangrovi]NVO24709.1 acyl dehydratase [Donghicola mangrovi]